MVTKESTRTEPPAVGEAVRLDLPPEPAPNLRGKHRRARKVLVVLAAVLAVLLLVWMCALWLLYHRIVVVLGLIGYF